MTTIPSQIIPNILPGSFRQWLESLPVKNGDYLISTPRSFAHDEDSYDAQYGNEPINLAVGAGVVQLYRECGGDFSDGVIEIGCGTGLMSLGLVAAKQFPHILLTDPSPKFLDITRKKIARAGLTDNAVGYGVLLGEELSLLPQGIFSLILLRSVLHHVIDVEHFIADAARALKPGAMMIMEEPCQEGFVVLATLAQFIPMVMEQARVKLDRGQRKMVQTFLDTMKFYCRRDIDKSTAEDKHLFRVDELMKMGERAGLRLDFFPNQTFYDWNPPAREHPNTHSFTKFFHDYLKYAMGFDDSLMNLFNAHFVSHCGWIEELAAQNNGPYMHGVFVWKKA